MNILFDINHPAHVHLFRNAITTLKSQGHKVIITARDKDVTLNLLDAYHLPYQMLSKAKKGLFGLAIELILREWKIFWILRNNKISACLSVAGACSVHACKLLGVPSLVFYDTEHATLQNMLTIPFATQFFTPDSFKKKCGSNHVTYDGVHDLAYLHPNYFTPNPDIYNQLGLQNNEKFIIMRFVSWGAAHDVGQKHMSLEFKRKMIKLCKQFAKVFIVSESPLIEEFEPYRLTASPEIIFDILNFATLYIGDGGSMATESAILGTPAIFISPLTAGVFDELENKYHLMYTFSPMQEENINQTIEQLLKDENIEQTWKVKRDKFLADKIDLTDFMLKSILQYA